MLVIPAIDIIDGQCVRLTKGDYNSKKVYDSDPLKLAKKFEEEGSEMLHIVDLDAAKSAKSTNIDLILKIKRELNIPIQVGGGIRSFELAKKYLEAGVDRIVIGTKAIEDVDFLKGLLYLFNEKRIVVSLDVLNGNLAVEAWQKDSGMNYLYFADLLKEIGLRQIICTDISRDGTLTKPNFALAESLVSKGFDVIVAGGVSDLYSIQCLENIACSGAIVGKAIYEGKVNFPDLLSGKASNLSKRIIPCLDVKDGRVVKGIKFKDLVDAGDPVQLAKRYSREGADELVFLDISATLQQRESIYELIEKVAASIFIPFTVGGGISTLEQARKMLLSGADKVAINSAALKNPELISQIARYFGRQCVVVAIDAKKVDGEYKVFAKSGTENTNLNVLDWARKVQELGAGEILLTSMDRDGTKDGFDSELLELISQNIDIPLIASGGAGDKEDFLVALQRADAALAASVFHYRQLKIPKLKRYLLKNNLKIRL